MFNMRPSTLALAILLAMILSGVCATARSQTDLPSEQKLNVNAALVLNPEFCTTVMKKNHETFDIGKVACEVFKSGFEKGFTGLTVVEAAPMAGDAQIVLLPRLADVTATKTMGAFSDRELTLFMEWTVKDKSGRTIWIGTVQGSAKNHMGNAFTYKTDLKEIIHYAVQDLANKSVVELDASPQIRKIALQSAARP
jgi:hypothetical protein